MYHKLITNMCEGSMIFMYYLFYYTFCMFVFESMRELILKNI